MKTFITNILKFVVVATVFLGGATFAMAGNFESQPPAEIGGNGSGFLTLSPNSAVNGCPGCANSIDSVSINAPNPGDTDIFSAFMYYRNNGSGSITNARARLNVSGNTLTGTLSGSGASSITDRATLTNLPSNYDIDVISVYTRNTQGTSDPDFCSGYDYRRNGSAGQLSSSGVIIGDYGVLDDQYDGICSQAYVYVTYEVTNTESDVVEPPTPTSTEVETRAVNTFDTDSALLRGRLSQGSAVDVYFVYDDSNNISCASGGTRVNVANDVDALFTFDRNITGLNEGTTYYYRACAERNGVLLDAGNPENFTTNQSVIIDETDRRQVETLFPQDIRVIGSSGQATLRGRITSGSSNFVYFVWGNDGVNLSCASNSSNQNRLIAQNHTNNYTVNSIFSAELRGLNDNNNYRYRACASDNTITPNIVQGNYEYIEFSNGPTNGDSEPQAETQRPSSINKNSTQLNGRIRMNDFNNGIVFYVYGQDRSEIEDITDFDEYSLIRNNGDNLQKVRVDNDNDESGWRRYFEDVSRLQEDNRYYYRICVEFRDNNSDNKLECGGIENFRTEGDSENRVNIVTNPAQNITRTTARMCGEVTDGGSDVVSWIEFRQSSSSQRNESPRRQRGEVAFCEDVSNLQPGTSYRFRACAEERCGVERSFRTAATVTPQGTRPFIFTEPVTNIRSNSATLNSNYVANAPTATCRYNYGRTQALGQQTRSYSVNGLGQCPHNFTNLASGTRYCVQATITTQFGTDTGAVRCFNTAVGSGPVRPTPTPPQEVVIEDEDDDLGLGFGLSLVRLDIDDNEDTSIQGDNVEYIVQWENISELDLEDLDMRIEIPQEIDITDVSRGRFDQNSNTIFFTIDELDGADFEDDRRGDRGEMSVFGVVGRGTEGNLLTADAELAYDNPVNGAQENARDFDVNTYRGSQLTASIFGLADITFLGWLVILLGLFIIFLVARWLYLEREELRAQSYIGGGYPNQPYGLNGGYNQTPPQQVPMYRDPSGQFNQAPPAAPQMPPAQAPQNNYEPYRPNRG